MKAAPLFRSWFLAGFESSVLVFPEGAPRASADPAAEFDHHARAAEDYALVAAHGLLSARDALDWRQIEPEPGRYDTSSFLGMLRAAGSAGVQVAWDLLHFGLPAHVDPWSSDFPERFAAYAEAAARAFAAERVDEVPIWCPINEISFWTWSAERDRFAPDARGRGPELKRQFARAAILAIQRLRAVDPRARILLCEPVVHTVERAGPTPASEAERVSMFEAWDIIAGRRNPELGGAPELLDLIGVNYYAGNQWFFDEGRTPIPPGHPAHRPLHDILMEVWRRYRRPILLSETGAEDDAGPAWLRDMANEVEEAQKLGARIEGLCLYPVMDYPGWVDGRHCRCGLIRVADGWGARTIDPDTAAVLDDLQRLRAGPADRARPNWLRRLGPAPPPPREEADEED